MIGMPITDPLRRAFPADATIAMWTAPDGWGLRCFDWRAAGPNAGRGAILFQGGRGDVFEKYLETFGHWHAAGWSVTSFDWRGQGGSGRLSPDRNVGHIADFAPYIADLEAFWADWRIDHSGPCVIMGHSMGGHLVLRAMLEARIDPDAAVLIAPMLGIRGPIGPWASEKVAQMMRDVGDPARAAWKGHERPGVRVDRQRLLTADRSRYEDELWWYDQVPELKLGPPSWAWLAEAFGSTRAQQADPRLTGLRTPILTLVADADGLVDAKAAVALAARLPESETLRFGKESAHEILREADPVRDRALAAIDTFLDQKAVVS